MLLRERGRGRDKMDYTKLKHQEVGTMGVGDGVGWGAGHHPSLSTTHTTESLKEAETILTKRLILSGNNGI